MPNTYHIMRLGVNAGVVIIIITRYIVRVYVRLRADRYRRIVPHVLYYYYYTYDPTVVAFIILVNAHQSTLSFYFYVFF